MTGIPGVSCTRPPNRLHHNAARLLQCITVPPSREQGVESPHEGSLEGDGAESSCRGVPQARRRQCALHGRPCRVPALPGRGIPRPPAVGVLRGCRQQHVVQTTTASCARRAGNGPPRSFPGRRATCLERRLRRYFATRSRGLLSNWRFPEGSATSTRTNQSPRLLMSFTSSVFHPSRRRSGT